MANKSYLEVLNRASSFLNRYGKEANIAEYLLLERLGWTKTDLLIHLQEAVPTSVQQQLDQDLEKILADYPPQYLIGAVDFFGERFEVTEATLIPRPETEELVEWCLAVNDERSLKVLDIGTGTGAIAVSLKKRRPQWQVSAIDLSHEALVVAKRNAAKLSTVIEWYEGDLIKPVQQKKFDLIISNPPYIAETEWEAMDESVRKFEPKLALFAENEGLAIYQRLAADLPEVLAKDGQIFLEIGYQQAEAVAKLFQLAFPKKLVEIKQDMQGLDRMIRVYGS